MANFDNKKTLVGTYPRLSKIGMKKWVQNAPIVMYFILKNLK